MENTYKLARCERETIFTIADDQDVWTCYTNIPKDMRKLERQGWKKIEEQLYSDGTPLSMTFEARRGALNIGKAEKTKRILSDEERRILSERAKNMLSKK